MRVLDRYLIRNLLGPLVFCAATLVFLIIVADIFDHLSEFLKNKTSLPFIVQYYLNLTPFVFMQIIPWASFLGTIFVFVNLNTHNEILAMKAAGLGISNIIRPVLFMGFLVGIAAFLINDQLVPPTLRQAQNILEERVEQRYQTEIEVDQVIHNFTYFSSANQLYYAKEFKINKSLLEDLIVLHFSDQKEIQRKIFAKEGTWNGKAWVLKHVTDYDTDSTGKILGEPNIYEEHIYESLTNSPQEFASASDDAALMSYQELKQYIKRLEENGLDALNERIAIQTKLASTWDSLVMMLIVIPLLSVTRRKKIIALNVLYCVGLVFLFHVLGAFTLALGKSGTLTPFIGAWTNNLIFGVGAIFFLDRANG